MTFKELERLLKADGWFRVSTRGSHYYYAHLYKPGKLTVPSHSGDLPKGTLHAILRQANLTEKG